VESPKKEKYSWEKVEKVKAEDRGTNLWLKVEKVKEEGTNLSNLWEKVDKTKDGTSKIIFLTMRLPNWYSQKVGIDRKEIDVEDRAK
jgi:hypothetical protein